MIKSILYISLFSVLAMSFTFIDTEPKGNQSDSSTLVHDGPIEWLTFEEAAAKHSIEPKYWVIDIYTDWCGWCKRMDATTFQDPLIAEEINRNFYAVKLDGEAKRDITINGKTFKFVPNGRRGHHELAAELLNGKMSYPSFSFLSNEAQIIQTIPGFKTKEEFLPILKYLGQEFYKTKTWEEYSASYSSPYPDSE